MKNPDLQKTWGTPDEYLAPKAVVEETGGELLAVSQEKAVWKHPASQDSTANEQEMADQSDEGPFIKGTSGDGWREILVFRNARCDQNLIGAAFASSADETLAEFLMRVHKELGVHMEGKTIYRHNSSCLVPIGSNQWPIPVLELFRSDLHVLIIK
jgi:hypothetical protein